MTRRDALTCIHEPFGDAFYFGPERLSDRYERNEQDRLASGFSESTYQTIFDRIERESSEVRILPPRAFYMRVSYPFAVWSHLRVQGLSITVVFFIACFLCSCTQVCRPLPRFLHPRQSITRVAMALRSSSRRRSATLLRGGS